jgi:hypothetical protein
MRKATSVTTWAVFVGFLLSLFVFTRTTGAVVPDEYEEDDNSTQASIIDLNDTPQGHNFHDMGDQDWVRFYGLHDPVTTITYQVETMNLGIDCDTVIGIYDTDGVTLLVEVDDRGYGEDEFLEWDFPEDGVYYVRARHFDETYDPGVGDDTAYELKVSRSIGPGPGWIVGVVKDSASGVPLGSVLISTDRNGSAISHPTGDYEMIHAPGSYTLRAKKDGYQDYSMPVTVPEEHSANGSFEMVGPCAARPAEASGHTPSVTYRSGWFDYAAFLMIAMGAVAYYRVCRRRR